jgi:hypothetical protein
MPVRRRADGGPVDQGLRAERRVGARSPGQCPLLTVTDPAGRAWISRDEHRPHLRAICAFGASACGICAVRTPGASEQPTFNPQVRGRVQPERGLMTLHRSSQWLAGGRAAPADGGSEHPKAGRSTIGGEDPSGPRWQPLVAAARQRLLLLRTGHDSPDLNRRPLDLAERSPESAGKEREPRHGRPECR